ncbi:MULTISPECIES: hypothetical protein [unclassified Mesorhizobium]|uniref:hypothetical protein n=1 Tax=unclassified Mesorhizobium TaxID=325217 RepID=UPI001FEFA9C6|nr:MULTISPECIES: hypothetical protein [unclassified Mesorhizobium]
MLHTGIAYVLMDSAFPRLTTPVIGIITFTYPVVAIIIIIDWAVTGIRSGRRRPPAWR